MRPRRGYGMVIAREHATCNRGGRSDRLNILERRVTAWWAWTAGGRATDTCAGGRVLCSWRCAVLCCSVEAPGSRVLASTGDSDGSGFVRASEGRLWAGVARWTHTVHACTSPAVRLAPAGRCGVASLGPPLNERQFVSSCLSPACGKWVRLP